MTLPLQEDEPNSAVSNIPDRSLRSLLADEDLGGLIAFFEHLSASESLREVTQLSPKERDHLITILPSEIAAELVEEAPNEIAVDLVERLEADKAAEIMDTLGSDLQADVIGEMDQEEAEAILAEMTSEHAQDVRRLAAYDDDTAGGLMIAEVFTFRQSDSISQVLLQLASEEEEDERLRGQHPYVIDEDNKPIGVVSLRSLITSRRSASLSSIMVPAVTVLVSTPLDDLVDLFDKHSFLGLPVIETDGSLAGVVSRSAVEEALHERSEMQSLKRQGIVGDELRSMPLLLRSRRRLSWLSANIVLNIIAASVISAYEETLAAVIAIAIFLPMVSDMSGCSGNQAVGVSMRELTLGLVTPRDVFRVWLKEASIGIVNGIVLGLLIGMVAWIWKGNAYLGLVIGLALAINTVIAVSIGGIVPILLKRFGQDPAVASGPLLTTVTDMAGFFLVLSLAAFFMPQLLGA